MGGTVVDSRGWWRKKARHLQRIVDWNVARIEELERDYDVVESELRNLVESRNFVESKNLVDSSPESGNFVESESELHSTDMPERP